MKWKKDPYFDSIDSIHGSIELPPVISLKNCIAASPVRCIPVSDVSKKGLRFGIRMKVARFFRQYPSIFEEFAGPKYNLPWFRLTREAEKLHGDESLVFQNCRADLQERLRRFVLMSSENREPLMIIKGMPLRVVEMGDGLKGLTAGGRRTRVLCLQENAMKCGVCNAGEMGGISFPLFPSNGLTLKRKILEWLDEFQKFSYVLPHEHCLCLDLEAMSCRNVPRAW